MKRELEEQLASKWPEILRGRDKPPTESLMAFGFEHGDGWYSIVDALCEVLTDHARAEGREPLEASQVKQKMSSLKFYVAGLADDFERGAILLAQQLSGRVCEESGVPGRLYAKGGYCRVLAPEAASRLCFTIVARDHERPHPPVSWREAAAFLAPESRAAGSTAIDVPPGWSDIVYLLLSEIARVPRGVDLPPRIRNIRQQDGRLAVVFENGNEASMGAIAFAIAISERTDSASGAMQVPNLD